MGLNEGVEQSVVASLAPDPIDGGRHKAGDEPELHDTVHDSAETPKRMTTEALLNQLVTFAAVVDTGAPPLLIEDATISYGIDGAVVASTPDGEEEDHAKLFDDGDVVVRVNDTLVLGMPYARVAELMERTPKPWVVEFVPRHLLESVQQVVWDHRDTLTAMTSDEIPPLVDKEVIPFIVANKYAAIHQGLASVRVGGRQRFREWHVVVRLAKIECFATPGDVVVQSELSFVDAQCAVRDISIPHEEDSKTMKHALELRVDETTMVLVCKSEEQKAAWVKALTLAIDVAKELHGMKQQASKARAVSLTTQQIQMLQRLIERERQSPRYLLYSEATRRTNDMTRRMEKIGSATISHPDSRIQRSLREEYERLEHDRRGLTAAIAEKIAEDARCDRELDEQGHDATLEALKSIRRCMPVHIRQLSESELTSELTPSGLHIPPELAQRWMDHSVLQLLRTDPACFILGSDKSSLAQIHWLTLSEHRALYAHLRDRAKSWDPREQDYREWFVALKHALRRRVDVYNRHIARFGYQNHSESGCPLRDNQCPLDEPYDHHAFGFPDDAVYGDWIYDNSIHILPHVLGYEYGFLGAAATDTYGSSSIWNDSELLRLQLDADSLSLAQSITGKHAKTDTLTEVYAGTYQGFSVAVKRLAPIGKTLQHATALAFAAKSLSRLEHRNLVPLIGVCFAKALDIQVVTPLFPQGDLRSLLDSPQAASLTWANFKCQVAIDVLEGLRYLREKEGFAGAGAITSWNVLLDEEGTAKLNLVQLANQDILGLRDRSPSPLRWVAPEVILGGPPTTDSDIYAFGVLLTELDTTKRPFHDAKSPNGAPMEDMAIAYNVARQSLRPTLSENCPTEIAELVEKCLAQDPRDRPWLSSMQYRLKEVLKSDA